MLFLIVLFHSCELMWHIVHYASRTVSFKIDCYNLLFYNILLYNSFVLVLCKVESVHIIYFLICAVYCLCRFLKTKTFTFYRGAVAVVSTQQLNISLTHLRKEMYLCPFLRLRDLCLRASPLSLSLSLSRSIVVTGSFHSDPAKRLVSSPPILPFKPRDAIPNSVRRLWDTLTAIATIKKVPPQFAVTLFDTSIDLVRSGS